MPNLGHQSAVQAFSSPSFIVLSILQNAGFAGRVSLKLASRPCLTPRSTRTLSLRASVLKQFSVRVPQQ